MHSYVVSLESYDRVSLVLILVLMEDALVQYPHEFMLPNGSKGS